MKRAGDNSDVGRRVRCRSCGRGGGGYVNRCEQLLGDDGEIVMYASSVDAGNQTEASVNLRVYPPSTNEFSKLSEALNNLMLLEELPEAHAQKREELRLLREVLDYLKKWLVEITHRLAEVDVIEENLDVIPFTPVSSTCSSGTEDLSSAELQDQQEQQNNKPKTRKVRQAAAKELNPDSLEFNQEK